MGRGRAKKHHGKKKLPKLTNGAPVPRKGRAATVASTKLRDPVVRKEYKMKLPVAASSKEIAGAAHAMAAEVHKKTALDDQAREAGADFRSRRNAITERMKELADTIEKGTRLQEITVRERLVVETNEIEVVRVDTGEVVEKRTAKAVDRQEALFPGEPIDPTFSDGVEHDEDGAPT